MENKDLYIGLDSRIFELKAINYANLMKYKIIPFIEDMAVSGGYDTSDIDIYSYAHEIFCNLKKEGKLDELNRPVEGVLS